jgi:hypothetical protein
MRITMTRKEFETLGDGALIWRCVEPAIREMRGRSFAVKTEAFVPLTKGQRALLMFQMVQGHMDQGLEAFLEHLNYLLSNPGVWQQMKEGMRHFGEMEMLRAVGDMEAAYEPETEKDGSMKRPDLREIEVRLTAILPEAAKRIAGFIRIHPEEYVLFEG